MPFKFVLYLVFLIIYPLVATRALPTTDAISYDLESSTNTDIAPRNPESGLILTLRQAEAQECLLDPDGTSRQIEVKTMPFAGTDWTIGVYNALKKTAMVFISSWGGMIISIPWHMISGCYVLRWGEYDKDECEKNLLEPLREKLGALPKALRTSLLHLWSTSTRSTSKNLPGQDRKGASYDDAIQAATYEVILFWQSSLLPARQSDIRFNLINPQESSYPAFAKAYRLKSNFVLSLTWKARDQIATFSNGNDEANIAPLRLYQYRRGMWLREGEFPLYPEVIENSDSESHPNHGLVQLEGNCHSVYDRAGCSRGVCSFDEVYEEWQRDHPGDNPDDYAIIHRGFAYTYKGAEFLAAHGCLPGCEDQESLDQLLRLAEDTAAIFGSMDSQT